MAGKGGRGTEGVRLVIVSQRAAGDDVLRARRLDLALLQLGERDLPFDHPVRAHVQARPMRLVDANSGLQNCCPWLHEYRT